MDLFRYISSDKWLATTAIASLLLFAVSCSDSGDINKADVRVVAPTSISPKAAADFARRAVAVVGQIKSTLPTGSGGGAAAIASARQPLEQATGSLDLLLADLQAPATTSPSTSRLMLALGDFKRALTSYLTGAAGSADPVSDARAAIAAADVPFRQAVGDIEEESGERIL